MLMRFKLPALMVLALLALPLAFGIYWVAV